MALPWESNHIWLFTKSDSLWKPSCKLKSVAEAGKLDFFLSITVIFHTSGLGFPGGTSGKESICQCRRCKSHSAVPGLGRPPGEGNGTPLQYACLENPMDKGAWWATVRGATESDTIDHAHTHTSWSAQMLFKKNHGHGVGAGKGAVEEAPGQCQSSAPAWSSWAQTHWQLPQQFIKVMPISQKEHGFNISCGFMLQKNYEEESS